MRYYTAIKRNDLQLYPTTYGPHKHPAECKKLDTKGSIVYDLIIGSSNQAKKKGKGLEVRIVVTSGKEAEDNNWEGQKHILSYFLI